jgi:hypothetical protein
VAITHRVEVSAPQLGGDEQLVARDLARLDGSLDGLADGGLVAVRLHVDGITTNVTYVHAW